MKIAAPLLLPLLLLFCSSCATIMSGTTQQLSFQSSPDGATVTIIRKPSPLILAANKPPDELILGITPLTVQILRTEFPQAVLFSKQGYRTVEMPLDQHINGWFWGNILLGGAVGSTTDSMSGAGAEYEPDRFLVTLPQEQASTIEHEMMMARNEQVRLFIVRRYSALISDLSRHEGEDLRAVFALLRVTPPQQAAVRTALANLAQRYPDAAVFATEVAGRYLPE
jgi:hypothetical protein